MTTGPKYGPRPWLQAHWDMRAATNFILGGAGSGLLISVALTAQMTGWRPLLAFGLALIAAGLGTVWLEIGRKLRAIHVFFNPFTSWMTRESFAALVVFGVGGLALVLDQPWLAQVLGLAALAFVFCQGRILLASKGIPAWRTPGIVALIVATSLAEGGGLFVTIKAATLATLPAPWLAAFALVLIARAAAWSRYRNRLGAGAPRTALASSGRVLFYAGTAAPLALLAIGLMLPSVAPGAEVLAGLAALAAGWRFKFALVRRAAFNQGFSLPKLPVRGSN